MRITSLRIRNFKSIQNMYLDDIDNALILVGQNNTGKTAVLDAIRAVGGSYCIRPEDFQENFPNIEVFVTLQFEEQDLLRLHERGIVSQYRRLEAWQKDFRRKLPSFDDQRVLSFEFSANKDGRIRYHDGVQKNNPYIKEVFPQIYYMDTQRDLDQLQEDLLMLQEDELLKKMRRDCCIFDQSKTCNHCFACIGLINQKKPEELDAFETAKLLDYKLYQLNLGDFAKRVNENFKKNGGQEEIIYSMNRDVERMLLVTAEIRNREKSATRPIGQMGKGMRSVYMLSLLETYAEGEDRVPSIIMVEDPEIFLHPRLQKVSGEILYRLSRKNQVIFSTHSPNLLANFSSRQIRQTVLDEEGFSTVREKTDISAILDDLGYTANDLMNVNFVFIVEGKQDKSRLPLLIRKYYSETFDEEGNLSRIAIITTNSCTNIKTYANLKYMNQIYLRDQFLMIRDGDGDDPEKLKHQLCRYYEERNKEDIDKLPRVMPQNVLILHYYSFENYFLNPKIMAQLGVIGSEEEFYEIFIQKWKEYLYKIRSGRHLREVLGKDLETAGDVKMYMEEIRVYLRGHNLYDIFYGRYKAQEQELLTRYIELAPREDFKDILDSIDRFIYFESRKKQKL
ncbi:OLD family endonuclease [Clostridium sp. AF19-22AC]|uniref:ATP-dependent nuclease n=1 Tax=Clostridia TaxID=186801 RepID=UPI000E4B84DB|nr:MULTISPECIES: AAA family ATPase [Clostridia]RHR24188.1 OLD family endonuclease [Clostridium sp. AF19-22AC]